MGVSRVDSVMTEEVRRRTGIKGSWRVEWIREYRDGFHIWKEWMNTVWPEGY